MVGYSIFAILIGRIDVSVALSILSKFNLRPASVHYNSAKNILKYLRDTQAEGPVYWRPTGKEIAGLPWGDLVPMKPESFTIPLYPTCDSLWKLEMMADCAFNNLTKIDEQKSTTGFLALFGGAVFFGKTKLQPTIALSSTEGEIRAGCTTAKCALYLRKVLADVGLQQEGPTPIYEDNQATIQFSNHNRPSGRTHHIARELYATQ